VTIGNAHWYALYLRSRYEKKVCTELQKKTIETFLPIIQEMHKWSDRKKVVQEPLFRGYIFVKTDLHDKASILMSDGVVRFVGINNKPSSIPDLQIDWLRRIVDESIEMQHEQYLNIGERVRVNAGPLIGIEGIVTRMHGVSRVLISIAAIEQSVSIQMPADYLDVIQTKKEKCIFELSKTPGS
jgi:transcription antitermination factor NusG